MQPTEWEKRETNTTSARRRTSRICKEFLKLSKQKPDPKNRQRTRAQKMHKGQVREKTPGPANRGKCKSELTATGPHRALEGQHGSGRNGLLPRIQSRAAAVEGRIAAPENVTTALPEDPEIPLCCCAGKIGKQGPEEMSVRPHRQQCSPPLLSHGAARGRPGTDGEHHVLCASRGGGDPDTCCHVGRPRGRPAQRDKPVTERQRLQDSHRRPIRGFSERAGQ